jgi:tetratricopeptide (TPR) repeat protein
MSKKLVLALCLAASVFKVGLSPAFASESAPSPADEATWDARARQLMTSGRLDEAIALVEARLAVAPRDIQARFLKGLIATARGQNRTAIDTYRSILIDAPGAARVRLELARAYFLERDFGNALRQFQFALAADPPAAVASNIQRYIAAIRQSKSVSYNVSVALAPDTNLNTGSSAREVTLFGLPFDLSDDATQRSGVGLALEGGGEWAPRIAPNTRLRIGANFQRREYSGSNFDDMTIVAYAGPRIVTGKWDVGLLATAGRRWYAAKPYNHSEGVRAEATYYPNGKFGISAAAIVQRVHYVAGDARNGPLVTLGGGVFYALTVSSAVNLKAGVSRQSALAAAYSNWSGFLAAGYFRELPMGFSAYIEPSVSIAEYDEALLAFGQVRSDRTQSVLATLLNRHLVLGRFTPRVSYTFTHQTSSIALYQFSRSRFELGLTTAF